MTAALINVLATPDAAAAAVAPAAAGRPPVSPTGPNLAQGAPQPFQAAMLALGNPSGDGPSATSLPPDQVVVGPTATALLDMSATLSGEPGSLLWAGGPDPGSPEPAAAAEQGPGSELPPSGNVVPHLLDPETGKPDLRPSAAALTLPALPDSADTADQVARTAVPPIAMAVRDASARALRPETVALNSRRDAQPGVRANDAAEMTPAPAMGAEPATETDALRMRVAQPAMEFPTQQADAQIGIRALSGAAAGGPEPASPALLQSAAAGGAQFDQLMQTPQLQNMRPLQPLADPDAFSQGLGQRLMVMSEDGVQSARLKLYPENLGALDIRIRVDDDTARVWFTAQHGQTREALEAAIPRLRDLFAEQGMQLVQADVETGRHDKRATAMFEQPDDTDPHPGDEDPGALPGPRPLTTWVSERSLDIYV